MGAIRLKNKSRIIKGVALCGHIVIALELLNLIKLFKVMVAASPHCVRATGVYFLSKVDPFRKIMLDGAATEYSIGKYSPNSGLDL